MTDTTEPAAAGKTPVHLWIVGGLSLLWNGFGAYDYLMTHTQGAAYMAGMGMTEAQIAYFTGMPVWMTVAWALGVWGALLGSILLLLRRKWAFHAFAISLLGLLGSWIHTFTSNAMEIMGTGMVVFSLVITAGAVFLLWYARTMKNRGVLR